MYFSYMYTEWVTKRCRLSWLTNSALLYKPKCGGWIAGSQPMRTAEHMELEQNFGDLTQYFTYESTVKLHFEGSRVRIRNTI
jgi:hypothetical protein